MNNNRLWIYPTAEKPRGQSNLDLSDVLYTYAQQDPGHSFTEQKLHAEQRWPASYSTDRDHLEYGKHEYQSTELKGKAVDLRDDPRKEVKEVRLCVANILKVSECRGNYMLLDERGKLYSFGKTNSYGVLGRGYEGSRYEGQLETVEQVVGLDN